MFTLTTFLLYWFGAGLIGTISMIFEFFISGDVTIENGRATLMTSDIPVIITLICIGPIALFAAGFAWLYYFLNK